MAEASSELRRLVEEIVLDDVRFHELGAKAIASEGKDEGGPLFDLRVDIEEMDQRADDESRRVAFYLRIRVRVDDGEVIAEPRATYHVPVQHADLLTINTAIEFANEVAVMTLLPFAREALSDMSLRVLDERILMPVFSRGEVTFPPPNELGEPDTSAGSPPD